MKIRITGNKLRLRLKEPEVRRLYNGEHINEVLEFGFLSAQHFTFTLHADDSQVLDVVYKENTIAVSLPLAFAKELAQTNKVGYDADLSTGDGKRIYVLIEKDFECIDGPEEDKAGAYPNPKLAC